MNLAVNAVVVALVVKNVGTIIGKNGRSNISMIEAATDERIIKSIIDVLKGIVIIFLYPLFIFKCLLIFL